MFPFIVCILNNRQYGACVDIPGCRFDLDSMLCMKEDGDSSKSESTQWALDSSSCPELDDCGYTSCSTCAQYGCMWCDSLNRCMDESDTVFDTHETCQGIMVQSEENCPIPFTLLTLVDGNLVVTGDVDLGDGALHISDSLVQLNLGGYVVISAANTDSPNLSASEILRLASIRLNFILSYLLSLCNRGPCRVLSLTCINILLSFILSTVADTSFKLTIMRLLPLPHHGNMST
jgi:hypothetical protein